MKALIWVTLAASAICAVSAACFFFGSTSPYQSRGSALYYGLVSIVFGLAFLGLRGRKLIVWRLGWGVIVVGAITAALDVLADRVANTPSRTFADFWLPIGLTLIFSIIVAVGWGFWWKSQRDYFIPDVATDGFPFQSQSMPTQANRNSAAKKQQL